MYIKTHDGKTITISGISEETLRRKYNDYPALRFAFGSDGISAEDILSIMGGAFSVYEESGALLGTFEGFGTLGGVSLTVAKVTTAEEERDALNAELEAAEQEKTELSAELDASKQTNAELSDALDILIGGAK